MNGPTDQNIERAKNLFCEADRSGIYIYTIARALDEAEARGRDAAKVEHNQAARFIKGLDAENEKLLRQVMHLHARLMDEGKTP